MKTALQSNTLAAVLSEQQQLAARRTTAEAEFEAERERLAAAHRALSEQRRPLFMLIDKWRLTRDQLARAKRDHAAVAALSEQFLLKVEGAFAVETDGPNVALFAITCQHDPVGASAERYEQILAKVIQRLEASSAAIEKEARRLALELDAKDTLVAAGLA